MTEESDDTDRTMQLRGTSSRPNPFMGKEAPDGPSEETTIITIRSPDGSVREYELTDEVKNDYEAMIDCKFDSMEVNWYEMWWEGTELVINYNGCVRDNDLRPDHEDMDPQKLMQMAMQGRQPKMDGIPKRQNSGNQDDSLSPGGMMGGEMPEPSVSVDVSDKVDDDLNRLDEGVVPVRNTTRINVQARADEYPLRVEDIFVKPWADEEGQMPVNSEHEDGEVDEEMFEVDFRDFTDDENKTVRDDARGDLWGLNN